MSKVDPNIVELWICANCAFPCVIEDGGFFPEWNYIKDGFHPAGYLIECGICCHDEYVKVTYEPTSDGLSFWKGRGI